MQENLDYIQRFRNKIIVIKYGGSAMKCGSGSEARNGCEEQALQGTTRSRNGKPDDTVVKDIAAMKLAGVRVVVVHGGGAEINALLKRVNKQPEFIEGLRVTDEETMELVEMALSGKVNKGIVRDLQKLGVSAVGISGKDGRTITARKILVNGHDVGLVGEAEAVDTGLILTLLNAGHIPVVAPVAQDKDGNSYNLNADYAAAAVAGALNAEKLVFITDVKGVLRDVNNPTSLIPEISVAEAEELIKDGTVSGGMIPKVNCCIEGVKKGVKTVHIIDGRVEESLLPAIFAGEGVGTRVYA
jgi:acetylglutamate kinase